MRKKILFMLSAFCFMGATVFGQAIEGGAGVIHVDGNPNLIVGLNTVTVNEGNLAYDKDTQILYYYDPTGTDAAVTPVTAGTHWIAVDITNLVDPITNILTPETELSTVIVDGVATITFESDATISYVANTNVLTFTDVDGDGTDIDLSELDDYVDAANSSITVTGTGTSADPFSVELTGAATSGNNGYVPVTNGTGTLTWTNVIKGISVTSDGTIDITTTDGTVAQLDMANIPTVANITELNSAATALGSGEEGLVRAAVNNTFGLPATSAVGVLFFISN